MAYDKIRNVQRGGTGVTSLTQFGILVGQNTDDVTVTAAGTDGQILIAATGADPAFASVTSSDGSITITPGANSLDITSAGGGDVVGSPPTTDNALVRWNGVTATSIKNSIGILTDAGALSGLTQLDVDNLRLDGNTLSSTDTNGDVVIDPDGTGDVQVTSGDVTLLEGAVIVDPGASGDSFIQFNINTTAEFRIGVDDDDGDSFKISQGSALGTNDTFVVTSSGEITIPLQPSFQAYLGTNTGGAGS